MTTLPSKRWSKAPYSLSLGWAWWFPSVEYSMGREQTGVTSQWISQAKAISARWSWPTLTRLSLENIHLWWKWHVTWSPLWSFFSKCIWTAARQAPLSMELSRQEHWSVLPFPSPEDLLNPGIEPGSPAWQVDPLLSEPAGKHSKSIIWV